MFFFLLLKTIKQLYYNLVLITGHNFSLVLHSFYNYIKLLRLTVCTFLLASVSQNTKGKSILCPPLVRFGHSSLIGLLVQIKPFMLKSVVDLSVFLATATTLNFMLMSPQSSAAIGTRPKRLEKKNGIKKMYSFYKYKEK